MKRAFGFASIPFLIVTACLVTAGNVAMGDTAGVTIPAPLSWNDCLKQKPEWYRTNEAVRIADNVLMYQGHNGGWPKNIDMAALLSEQEKTKLARQKQITEETIDNGATFTQLAFLARVHDAHHLERYQQAFFNGIDYLLKAQYANGGWPQYYPLRKGYYTHITYNDDAMIGVMKLLRDIAKRKPVYAFVDEGRRLKAEHAVYKGIECLLKTQVLVDGERTVWCAQHDEVTFAPAPARTFEPVSLSGFESVGIVRFLMGIDHPNEKVIGSINAAIAWFEKTQINGVRWLEKPDPAKLHGFDRVLIKDSNAGPLWARFYEIGTNRPIFMGRDSIVRYNVANIEDERRNGYQWYVSAPADLLNKDYPAWKKRVDVQQTSVCLNCTTGCQPVVTYRAGDKTGWQPVVPRRQSEDCRTGL